jgi:hypothetical protein
MFADLDALPYLLQALKTPASSNRHGPAMARA